MSVVRRRVGILISGRGSNMEALITAATEPDYPAEVALVISNRPDAPGLEKARAAGIEALAIDHKQYHSRASFEMRMHGALMEAGVEIVCNAGFMRMLTIAFVERWRNRHLNIHPSLLPAFPGLETHARVLESGALITGCTVHVVRTEMDAGPILAQAAVPVVAGDSPESLADRVLVAEHWLYPHALALLASGAARVEGDRVLFEGLEPKAEPRVLFAPPLPAEPASTMSGGDG